MTLNKSCNGCYYEHDRTCYWFEIVHGSKSKAIPTDTFEIGCKQYKNALIGSEAGNEIVTKVINIFNGEIIGDKYVPIKKKKHYYKKKTYTTRHNYTERKDF
tara:strand:- start:321 stop:626 length:306 start_codon:yes stop_codon:yes gene_type:complete